VIALLSKEIWIQRRAQQKGYEMESLLGPAARVLLIGFLVTVMMSVGLEVTARESVATLRNQRHVIGALLANFVVVPLLGLGIARIVPMPTNIETGFLLLAAAPGALFAINFTHKLRGSVPFAAAMLFLLTVLSLLFTPPLARLLLNIDRALTLPYGRAISALLLYIVLPMAFGLAINRWAHPLALKLQKPVSICAGLLFALEIVFTGALKSTAMKKVGINGLCAMLVLIIASMICGWLLGGPDDGTRRVLTVSTSLRNVALCLAIAARSFPGADVDVAVIAFSSLMFPPNAVFTMYHVRKMKKQAAQSVHAAARNPTVGV
jgi:BASS family bile acid:Na+ symporter